VSGDPYDGFVELASNAFRYAERRTRRADAVWQMRDAAEHTVEHVENELSVVANRMWASRAAVERELARRDDGAFRALDSMIGMSYGIGKLLQPGRAGAVREPPAPIPYVVTALLVRAISVAHEISALLRAGFPVGARARWRTLYELDVVGNVLAAGNRGTAARYVNHRWILLARDRVRDVDATPWAQGTPSPEAMSKRFIRRYGPTFSGSYGWAAEVTRRKLGVKSPSFGDLERVAQLDGHVSRLHVAHHGVHADSLGALLSVNESELLHSGARWDGSGPGCLEAIRVLGETTEALLRTWNLYARARAVNILQSLNDELSLVLQRDSLWAGSGEPAQQP
jgi:hypothetical protein